MADVTITASTAFFSGNARQYRNIVMTSALVGYQFFCNATAGYQYKKTTDGGATWGSEVNLVATGTGEGTGDVWYDKWTPGNTGTLVHIIHCSTSADLSQYLCFDTNGDSLVRTVTIFANVTAVAGVGYLHSITRAKSGRLYAVWNSDGGTEFGFKKSDDVGATWSADLGGTFNEGSTDQALLFPASGTGDDNDIWAIYYDTSATAVTMKMWDASAAAQVESSTLVTTGAIGTDLSTEQFRITGVIRNSDGHLLWAAANARDTATADIQTFDTSSVASGSATGTTAKTDFITNVDDCYHPQLFINQYNNDVYLFVNGKPDGTETLGTTTGIWYKKSTDGMATWGAAVQYSATVNTLKIQTWSTQTGDRLLCLWRVAANLLTNTDNALSFSASSLKTVDALAYASVKTFNGLAVATVKNIEGLA